jgi:sulfite exporter TauE/SafE
MVLIFDLLAPFIVGFIGSLHCLGMCGPLILAYSLHIRTPDKHRAIERSGLWRQGLSHHLAFHMGRLLTYGLLGALAGEFFHLASFRELFSGLRGSLTLGGGILMVGFGLVLLRVIPARLFSSPLWGAHSFLGRRIPDLFRSPRWASRFFLGLVTGFLPCMLSWAMIVKAATTSSPLTGFLTLISFGAGTIPALFVAGLPASLLSLRVRFFGERVAAMAVISMGFILVVKGAAYFA